MFFNEENATPVVGDEATTTEETHGGENTEEVTPEAPAEGQM